MAKAPDPFHEFVIELFAPMGPVSIRRMFGGAGVFCDGLMIALLFSDTIFLKTDAALRARLETEGSEPFLWTKPRSEEHTSELQSQSNLVCRLLLEKKQRHIN